MTEPPAVTALPGGGPGNCRFRAVVATVVPEAALLDDAGWREVESIIARALSQRPAKVRRQIALFIAILDVVALVRYRHRLAVLDQRRRTRLLESCSRSKALVIRRGVWGLRTLALMGYYARQEAARAIGYGASAAGWSARRGAPSVP